MEITAKVDTQQSTSNINLITPQPVNEKQVQSKELELNEESIVSLSPEAKKLSSDTETETNTATPISSPEDAQKAVTQFSNDTLTDPVLAQIAQGDPRSSTEASRLISQP